MKTIFRLPLKSGAKLAHYVVQGEIATVCGRQPAANLAGVRTRDSAARRKGRGDFKVEVYGTTISANEEAAVDQPTCKPCVSAAHKRELPIETCYGFRIRHGVA